MSRIESYLTREDFTTRIPSIPAAFQLTSMQPYWTQLLENWLGDLVPATHDVWGVVSNPDPHAAVRTAIKPFAVYAIWADFVLDGSFKPTESGLVLKSNNQSEYIAPQERAALHRSYIDKATRFAGKLRDAVVAPTLCGESDGVSVGPVRFGSVRPPNTSPF